MTRKGSFLEKIYRFKNAYRNKRIKPALDADQGRFEY
jgi:hypothetical protein